jgi:anti-anti-sigma factor
MSLLTDLPKGALLLAVPGDLISTTADTARTAFAATLDAADARQPAWNAVHLDLRNAQMIDSVGLNLLVSVIKRVKAKGGTVTAYVTHRNVERTLAFTRLNTQMQVERVA